LIWGRPKAWSHEQRNTAEQKRRYIDARRETVLNAMEEHNPGAPVVWGVEIGHTDPQQIIPSGGEITVDGIARQITVTY
jgi:muramoyltetrapeptide carboxypeptidase LdcA involved in peptidoglycan recycling